MVGEFKTLAFAKPTDAISQNQAEPKDISNLIIQSDLEQSKTRLNGNNMLPYLTLLVHFSITSQQVRYVY